MGKNEILEQMGEWIDHVDDEMTLKAYKIAIDQCIESHRAIDKTLKKFGNEISIGNSAVP